MNFLVDRCADHRLAQWLRAEGHDVVESAERGEDPGDKAILEWAATDLRILITIDKDFGELVFKEGLAHTGLVRLPDVPSKERIELMRSLLEEHPRVCWFSVKMTARLDVNATPGVRMSPLAPGIVPECSGASRVKRAARAGFAALDSPCALWYSLVVGERERSGAPGIRVFMRAPCYYAAHAAPLVPAPVSGPAPTRSLGPCQP